MWSFWCWKHGNWTSGTCPTAKWALFSRHVGAITGVKGQNYDTARNMLQIDQLSCTHSCAKFENRTDRRCTSPGAHLTNLAIFGWRGVPPTVAPWGPKAHLQQSWGNDLILRLRMLGSMFVRLEFKKKFANRHQEPPGHPHVHFSHCGQRVVQQQLHSPMATAEN